MPTTVSEYINWVRQYLAKNKRDDVPLGKLSGKFLYSDHKTLKKGNLYLLGTNPGGEPLNDYEHTIIKNIEDTEERIQNREAELFNDYLSDTDWAKQGQGRLPKKLIPLFQPNMSDKNVTAFRKVCASNLILRRTKDTSGFDKESFKEEANLYWPIHQYLICNIVDPDIIVVFGNGEGFSPYSYLRDMANNPRNEIKQKHNKSSKGHLRIKAFIGTLNLTSKDGKVNLIDTKARGVIGLPHPTYFKTSPEVFHNVMGKVKAELAQLNH